MADRAKPKATPPAIPWVPNRDLSTPEARQAYAVACSALQALARGDADERFQQLALDYVINNLCATYDMSFRPEAHGGDRATVFAEGKRFVGLQLVTMLKTNPTSLAVSTDEPTEQG